MTAVAAWVLLGVVLLGVEMATGAWPALGIALGAVLTGAVSLGTDQVWVQSTAFVLTSVFLVVLTRRWSGATPENGDPGLDKPH